MVEKVSNIDVHELDKLFDSEKIVQKNFKLRNKTIFLLDYVKHLLMLTCQKYCSRNDKISKKCLSRCFRNIGVSYNDIIYRALQLYMAYLTGSLHECLKCNDDETEDRIDDKIIKAIDLAFYKEFILKEKEREEKEFIVLFPRIQKLSVTDILKLQRMKSRKVKK